MTTISDARSSGNMRAGSPPDTVSKSTTVVLCSYESQELRARTAISTVDVQRLRAYIVMLGRLPHRSAFAGDTAADRFAVEAALRAVDRWEFRDRVLDQLSGGEQARILLARALAVEAPFLFAGEPVAALDSLHQLRVMDLLRERVRQKSEGVVIVLHDLGFAMRYCDRLILLD